MTLLPELVATDAVMNISLRCLTEHRVDGLSFGVRGGNAPRDDVHQPDTPTGATNLSIRTAVALNSAVPDFGSVASIVN